MPIFDQLERASFGRLEFPVESVRIRGGIRDHIHEYPHADGGAPEKMGRKLYVIEMAANFQATFDAYPNLWPSTLGALRSKFEAQTTDVLSIPTIGKIKAYCRDWEQVMDAKILSGERAPLTFVEDQSDQFLTDSLVRVDAASIAANNNNLGDQLKAHGFSPSVFSQIQDAVNGVLAIRDQGLLFGNLVEAKILGAIALIREADATVDLLRDPMNHGIVDALHELWLACVQLAENVAGQNQEIREFIVPREMSVSDISIRLYGNTDRATDIMQLNPLEDPFAVPAGFHIHYYAAA